VQKQGFKVASAKNVEVVVGRISNLTVKLEPGAVDQTVEVSATALTVM